MICQVCKIGELKRKNAWEQGFESKENYSYLECQYCGRTDKRILDNQAKELNHKEEKQK